MNEPNALRRPRFLFVPVLLVAAVISCSATACYAQERAEKALQDRVAAGRYQAAVMVVIDGDKSKVLAFGKLDDGRAPDAETVFEVGSVTKTFTGALLAEAVLQGRVQLNEPVANLLPNFKIPERGGKPISLLDLADMRSGLPRTPTNFTATDSGDPSGNYDEAKLKLFLADYKLTRDPGASFEYSNVGFGLLGVALATSAHESYPELIKNKLLRPLGMTESGVAITTSMRAHLAPGHDAIGNLANIWASDGLDGAGELRSTARDMTRYLRANMGLVQTPLNAAMAFARQPRSDATPKDRIGLGWETLITPKGTVVCHNGMTDGFASFIGFTADGRRGVVLLANTASSVDDLGFSTLLTDWPVAPTYKVVNRRAIVLPSALLQDYVGTYRFGPGADYVVTLKNGELSAKLGGQDVQTIYPSAKNEFFYKAVDAQLTFERDEQDKIKGIVLHQDGHDYRMPRAG